jgi:hypothetical protein
MPWSGHKLGGRPYFVNRGEPVEQEVNDLLREGYEHVLQMDFPGNDPDAEVSGAWPFGTGMFHVLGRARRGEAEDFLWFFEL